VSAENFVVGNPKGNNVDLLVTFMGRDGNRKKFKLLRPGEACRCDKREVLVTEQPRPPRLLSMGDGLFVKDRARGPRCSEVG
jgi:hypothetical protein